MYSKLQLLWKEDCKKQEVVSVVFEGERKKPPPKTLFKDTVRFRKYYWKWKKMVRPHQNTQPVRACREKRGSKEIKVTEVKGADL